MIELSGVRLERRTREEHALDLRGRIVALASGRYRAPRRRVVLDGIDLHVRRGEKLGIIGSNGAGKSTLLKLICGILQPMAGTVEVRGRVSAMLELGAGFDPDLTVEDNIILYGVLLGLDRRDMERRVDNMLRFAELEEFRTYPVKALSSGMAARLGFAVVTDVDADILLVDEVFAVGDESFRARSRQRIDELWHADRTVVAVSHDLGFVRSVCERVVWIEHGRVAAMGPPEEVIGKYMRAVDDRATEMLMKAGIDV